MKISITQEEQETPGQKALQQPNGLVYLLGEPQVIPALALQMITGGEARNVLLPCGPITIVVCVAATCRYIFVQVYIRLCIGSA